MSEDVIETIIGRFGKYQVWVFILISLGSFPTEYQLNNVVFILPDIDYVCMDDEAYNLTNHCPCTNPVYDQSTILSSVTNTWDLICDKRHLASLAQSFLHVGILCGSLLYGLISDRFGRKNACLLSLSSVVVLVALSAAATDLWMFIVLRFLIGTSVGGTSLCCYILIIELSGKSFRPYLSGLIEISYIVAYFTLPILAYYIKEWRYLQLATSVPWLFVILYNFLLPESPRWLITMGKKEEAVKVLTYIAKKNKRPTDSIETIIYKLHEEANGDNQQSGTYLDLFRTPKMRVYTIFVALIWLCCAHTFFGVNQFIGTLEGNIYLNVMLSAVSLVPGMVLVIIASLYLRRKVAVMNSFALAGVSLLIIIFLPSDFTSTKVALAMIGQIGAYTAFVQVYLYTSEVFPTVVRNSAMGLASVFARFGGFIAPFVVNIKIEVISIVIFSAMAFCAAALCYFLPETKDSVLVNTIEEIEDHTKKDVDKQKISKIC